MARKPEPKRPRRWLRRLGIFFLVALGLLVIFHRPLVFEGTRYFVVRAAKQQNLDLDYRIDGSIFTTLSLSKLVARPTEPGPVQRLEIGTLNLRYSLIDALRHGLPALLKLVDVRDVYVEITPGESPPPAKDQAPQSFKFPALFPETLNLANVNFRAHAPGGDTVLAGLFFSRLPDRPGELRVAELAIPGVRRWEDIFGRTTYRDRNLQLTDLRVGSAIALERLTLDASRLDEQELRLALEGEIFGAWVALDAHVADLNATNRLTVWLDGAGLDLARIGRELALDLPVTGALERVTLDFQGEPARPASWVGSGGVRLRDLVASPERMGDVDVDVKFGEARALTVLTVRADAGNRVDAWLGAILPERIADFPATTADAFVNVTARDLARFGVGGGVFARVDARLENRAVGAAVSVTSDRLRGNALLARLRYRLPDDLKSWAAPPLEADLTVDAPQLRALSPEFGGTLRVTGKVAAVNGVIDGHIAVEGRELAARGVVVRTLDGRMIVERNHARAERFEAVFDDLNRVTLSGEARLAAPWTYAGQADIGLNDLARFPFGAGGKLTATWRGRGDAQMHAGELDLALANGRFATIQDAGLTLRAGYTRERVTVSALSARLGPQTLLEGSLDVPFAPDQPLGVALRTRALDVAATLRQLGQSPAPLAGTVDLSVDATGTLHDLVANVALRAARMQSPAADEIAPTDVALDLKLRDDRLALTGDVRQRLIEPLTIRGNLPLDVERLLADRALDPATPVELRVALPRSSLAFVRTLVPAVRQSRGSAAVDVNVGGTIGAPSLIGAVAADLEALRFADPSLPGISDFSLRLAFDRTRLRIERGRGSLGGGTFALGGGVDFQRLDRPILDLRFGARNALALQNDDLTARVSGDVRVTGPMDAARVSGTVLVTRSRFFKDIDILPIGLPGRPAPQPPAEPPAPVSFPDPPLRDWTFDLAIRTADPFLVESNLARGRITMDLRLGGTGLAPWLDGGVRIEQLSASLPFSRLNIDDGLVYFTRDAPFVPKLDLRGTSTIRDYDVTATIFGTAYAPQAVFTSNPRLPQAEVVALIATGTTTQELGRDPNALAGRAALLAFQKLSRTVFKPKPGAPPASPFLSRVQVDAGATDPKTGRQSVTARLPLNDQFALVGGVDVGGNFRGQVKYLIRFR